MAEVNEQEVKQPVIDEAKIAELVKQSSSNAVKEALAELRAQNEQQQQYVQQEPVQPEPPTFWDEQINPRLAPVQQGVRQANLRAEAAEDKADFYQSELWTEDINDYLTGETESDIKEEKRELRKKIEDTFNKLMKEGRALPRLDIAKYVMFEHANDNKSKLETVKEKKRSKKQELELERAKAAVDISSGNITNFEPDTIHSLSRDERHEKYANFTF